MRKLLMLIVAMVICDAYGEKVVYFNGDNVYETTQCEDKNSITMPTQGNPQKTGYRFMGWKEVPHQGIASIAGTASTPTGHTYNNGMWSATFSYGVIEGKATCSKTVGTCPSPYENCSYASSIDLSNTGAYCWCKVTNSDGLFNDSVLPWVRIFVNSSSNSSCRDNCPYFCGFTAKDNYKWLKLRLFFGEGKE